MTKLVSQFEHLLRDTRNELGGEPVGPLRRIPPGRRPLFLGFFRRSRNELGQQSFRNRGRSLL